jgi:hypothetical protein
VGQRDLLGGHPVPDVLGAQLTEEEPASPVLAINPLTPTHHDVRPVRHGLDGPAVVERCAGEAQHAASLDRGDPCLVGNREGVSTAGDPHDVTGLERSIKVCALAGSEQGSTRRDSPELGQSLDR